MADPQSEFEIELVDSTSHFEPPMTLEGKYQPPPPEQFDRELDRSLERMLDANAREGGLQRNQNTRREHHTIRPQRGVVFHGGMPGFDVIDWNTVTYVAGSSAAFVVFLKNALDTLIKWRDLRRGRTVKVRWGKRTILVNDEAAAKKLREELATAKRKKRL